MDYELFKKKVLDEFLNYLDPEYSGYVLKINDIRKNNQKLTGVSVAPDSPKGTFAAPTFYIETMYREYQECGNFAVVIANTADMISNALRGAKPKVPAFTARSLLENVILQLISVKGNEDYLKDLPHRYFLDMAVIYRRIISMDDHGIMSFVIDNYLAEHANITEEQLYNKAYANTQKLFPPICCDMRTLLDDMSEGRFPKDSDDEDEPLILVITNDHKYLAATAMLYPEFFEDISNDLDTDLVILPSSVHDLIVLPCIKGMDREVLCSMVEDVNSNHMSKAEVLSFNVYGYKKGAMKVGFYPGITEEIAV